MTTPGKDLIQRSTLEELLGWRSRALKLAEAARVQHIVTLEAIKAAGDAAGRASSTALPFYKLDDYVKNRFDSPDQFTKRVRDDLDRHMWQHLLTISGIESLMDERATKEFTQQLSSDPPEITAETVRATFQQFKKNAYSIFYRGLVNAFTSLDRNYRSHDGFKIGTRLVRSFGLSDMGSLSGSVASLRDIDRIMHILDGNKITEGWSSGLVSALNGANRGSFRGIQPGSITTEYWHAKWFKNRNLHLYPQRKDLVRRANRLIALHFGQVVGEGPDAAGARSYQRAKPYHSEVEDFYPTPEPVVARMLAMAQLRPGMEILEPSAGDGAIVRGLLKVGIKPDCVENHPDRADALRDMLPPGAVMNMDFLKVLPEPEYDCVLMNPPFGKGAGVQHVFHAVKFLKPGGCLVAVLGAGLSYRDDKPTMELRRLIQEWGGTITSLPAGSFRLSGTEVSSVMVAITKPHDAASALAASTKAAIPALL